MSELRIVEAATSKKVQCTSHTHVHVCVVSFAIISQKIPFTENCNTYTVLCTSTYTYMYQGYNIMCKISLYGWKATSPNIVDLAVAHLLICQTNTCSRAIVLLIYTLVHHNQTCLHACTCIQTTKVGGAATSIPHDNALPHILYSLHTKSAQAVQHTKNLFVCIFKYTCTYTVRKPTLSLFTILTASRSPFKRLVTSFTTPKLPWPSTLPKVYFLSTAPSSTRICGLEGSGGLRCDDIFLSTLLISAITMRRCPDCSTPLLLICFPICLLGNQLNNCPEKLYNRG